MELRWVNIGSPEDYNGYIGAVLVFNVYIDRLSGVFELYQMYDYYVGYGESQFKGTLEECKAEALRLLTTSP